MHLGEIALAEVGSINVIPEYWKMLKEPTSREDKESIESDKLTPQFASEDSPERKAHVVSGGLSEVSNSWVGEKGPFAFGNAAAGEDHGDVSAGLKPEFQRHGKINIFTLLFKIASGGSHVVEGGEYFHR